MRLPFAVVLFVALVSLPATAATVTVGHSGADFLTDGTCDEEQVNQAIDFLGAEGGTVHIVAGAYSICANQGTYGGIIVDKSNVTISGDGPATLLALADNQNTNVIRIVGSVENITIKNIRIDGNRANNPNCSPPPGIPHERFECTGIKAHHLTPDDYRAGNYEDRDTPIRRIWVRSVIVEDSGSVNVMLSGQYVYVWDSFIGDARSDAVELLIGPGQISRSTLVVDGTTGYGLSSDAANDVQMHGNIIHVVGDGTVSQSVIRTWAGHVRNQINDNLVIVENGDSVEQLVELNSAKSMLNGNLLGLGSSVSPKISVHPDTMQDSNLFLP